MSAETTTATPFLDSNVLLYLISADREKAHSAHALLQEGGVVSVQVLNEVASVTRRRLGLDHPGAVQLLSAIRQHCRIVPLDIETHDLGMALARRYRYSVYDSMILAAAIHAGCPTVMSEDMQAGQSILGQLVIRNPFAPTVH